MRAEDGPPQHPPSTVHSTHRQNAKIRLEKTKDEFTLLNKRLQELKEDFETTETKESCDQKLDKAATTADDSSNITELEITELKMSLDGSNKGNAQMKNTIMRLTEFEVAYKKMTDNYTKSTAVIKDYEDKFNDMNMKVIELTSINNQLVTVRKQGPTAWT